MPPIFSTFVDLAWIIKIHLLFKNVNSYACIKVSEIALFSGNLIVSCSSLKSFDHCIVPYFLLKFNLILSVSDCSSNSDTHVIFEVALAEPPIISQIAVVSTEL